MMSFMFRTNQVVDALILSGMSAPGSVRRDAEGLVTAFRVLPLGRVKLSIDGQKIEGEITPADLQSILDHFAAKGEDIPVDCEHLLQVLADLKGITEGELVKADPLLGEKAAAGFVRLTQEADGLWATVTKWSARARELLSGNSDKLYQYFSPVLRGLKNPPLRVTSIALTNVPAIAGQDSLAAAAEGRQTIRVATADAPNHKPNTEDRIMDWLKKLAGLVGIDVASLTEDSAAAREPVMQKAAELIESLRAGAAKIRDGLKDALPLTDTDTEDAIVGKILSLVEKGKTDAAALTDLQGKVKDLSGRERDRYIEDLKREGKLTAALVPWAQKQDMAALVEWAKAAPVIVDPKRTTDPAAARAADADVLVMSELDIAMARKCGLNPEDVAKANGLKMPATKAA